ncbi:MAG: HD-GYP domain-containing protein [Candidatus Omnitrophota bacterium]|nr:HD-GYP domain-containing protein [Candidatus Omnitrophota bacterium]
MSKAKSENKSGAVIDYQGVLRDIAKSMVRLRRPERLLRMIIKYIHQEMNLSHASILVFQENQKYFSFVDSKGSRKIPPQLVKLDMDHPLAKWFQRGQSKELPSMDYLSRAQISRWMGDSALSRRLKDQLRGLIAAMDILNIDLAIPGYYKRALLGLLLLGEKRDQAPFTDPEIAFFQVLAQDCSMAVKTAEYHQSLLERNRELSGRLEQIEDMRQKEQDTYYQIMRSLAQEVWAKDAYTFGHIGQVERLGIMTARELGLELTEKKRAVLSAGLILHDVGKIGIPDHILNKPSSLDKEEWKIMRTHVEKGVRILEPLTAFKEVREIVRCHHEQYDGSGYPRGIRGDQIPIGSRIVSVVDAFHAIVSTRCYSKGRPVAFAFEELRRCSGTQFDPEVVEAMIRALTREMKKRGNTFFESPHQAEGPSIPEESVAS